MVNTRQDAEPEARRQHPELSKGSAPEQAKSAHTSAGKQRCHNGKVDEDQNRGYPEEEIQANKHFVTTRSLPMQIRALTPAPRGPLAIQDLLGNKRWGVPAAARAEAKGRGAQALQKGCKLHVDPLHPEIPHLEQVCLIFPTAFVEQLLGVESLHAAPHLTVAAFTWWGHDSGGEDHRAQDQGRF